MVAAASMLFASCSQDDIQVGQPGDESTVTVTLTTPKFGSRAYSDGHSATHLQYALYDVTYDNTVTRLDKYTVLTETIDITKNIPFKLVNGHTYRFVFWASNPNLDGPYKVTFGESSAQFDIDLENFDANILSNLEYLDAFYVCEDVKVTGDMQKTFELRRPFAQVNLGTDDYADAAAVGYVPTLSQVVVSNVYTTLNLFDGTVSNGKEVSFNYNVIGKNETFPYVDEADETHVYTYLNMIYMLVDKEQELVDLTYSWKEDGKTPTDRTIGSVPVQRNYRTNIFGSILTNDVDVNIVIVPDYFEPDYNVTGTLVNTAEAASSVASQGGDVIFEDDIKCGVLTQNAYGQNWAAIIQNGGTIDGAGNTLNVAAYNGPNGKETYGIYTSGGTIKNLTVVNAFRGIFAAERMQEDLFIENCVLKGAYTINTAGSTYPGIALNVKDSELYGWTTWAAFEEATFDNCKFLPSVAWPTTKDYWLCRAYVTSTFNKCEFHKDYTISIWPNGDYVFTFNGCTVDGQPLSLDNLKWELQFYKTDQNGSVIEHRTTSHSITIVIDGETHEVECPDCPHEGKTVRK